MVAPAAVRSEDPSGHVGQVSEPWIGRSVPRVRVLPSTNSDAVADPRPRRSRVGAAPVLRVPLTFTTSAFAVTLPPLITLSKGCSSISLAMTGMLIRLPVVLSVPPVTWNKGSVTPPMTEILLEKKFVTYARAPSGVKATPTGRIPTATVAITVLVAVLITETLFVPSLATYARDPSGVKATPPGRTPTGTVAITVLVAVLITETLFEPSLATYARAPSGVRATPKGLVPTGTVAMTALVAVLMTETVVKFPLATYARAPSGVRATPAGVVPTTTVAATLGTGSVGASDAPEASVSPVPVTTEPPLTFKIGPVRFSVDVAAARFTRSPVTFRLPAATLTSGVPS